MKEEGKKQSPFKQKVVTFKNKQWFYPAIYVSGAAIILIGAMLFQLVTKEPEISQNSGQDQTRTEQQGEKVKEVAVEDQFVRLPVADQEKAVIAKKFYEASADEAARQAALVSYQNQYMPNTGIDVAMEDDSTFDVIASLSGTVISTIKDPVLGNCVTVEHKDGITTMYQALGSIVVEPGTPVVQGQLLGTSGTNLLNPDLKSYVHFEVRKDEVAINPETALEVAISDLVK